MKENRYPKSWHEPTELSLKLLDAVGEDNNRIIVTALGDAIANAYERKVLLENEMKETEEYIQELYGLLRELTGSDCHDLFAPVNES